MSKGVILVTGGTGTLGSALVRRLCSGGWRVFANYSRDEARAVRLCEATGCEMARAGVGDEDAVNAMFAELPPSRQPSGSARI